MTGVSINLRQNQTSPLTTAQVDGNFSNLKAAVDSNTDAATALQLADYPTLRAYTGPRQSVYVTGYLVTAAPSGIAGVFVRDDTDTTTADDNATCIVTINGARFKRQYSGVINILWYSELVFTAAAKSPTDPASHTETSFSSWRNAIQAALNAASALGGGTVLIPHSVTPYLIDDTLNVGANTRIVFEGTVKLADYTSVGAAIVVNGNNVVIDNPLIDASGIYAGGSGQNGIGIVTGSHIRVNGGHIQNCACGSSNGNGGKAVQIEAGAGEDIIVSGTAMSNCFMGMSTIRDGGTTSPYHGILFSTIKADNCSILFLVKQTNINDVTGLQHTVQLDNFYALNCGTVDGVMQFSRASNVLVSNGVVINDPAVVTTALIRGNHRNCRFENIMFSGSPDAIINLDPGTYSPDNSYSPANNIYDIHHMGTVNYLINSTATVDMNCTGTFQLQNDVNTGFFAYPLRNGNSTFQVSQGGKTAIVGTNTNFYPNSAVYKFGQLPLNFSIPNPNYPQGTWTPADASGANMAMVTAYGDYVKIGTLVIASFAITFPSNATTYTATIGGLPFASANNSGRVVCGLSLRYTDFGGLITAANNPGATTFSLANGSGTILKNSDMSGHTIQGVLTYLAGA